METKQGYKTTEFWVGLVIPQLLAMLVGFGVITPEAQQVVGDNVSHLATNNVPVIIDQLKEVIALGISAISALGYNIGRGIAKQGIEPKP